MKSGYLTIASKIGGRNGKNICKRVHRWVAEAFIANPEEKPFVNHKDGVKTNNHVDNLEWCTAKENMIHASDSGLLIPCTKFGKENKSSKLTDEQVREIRNMKGILTQRVIGEMYGVSHTTVGDILRGDSWSHVE